MLISKLLVNSYLQFQCQCFPTIIGVQSHYENNLDFNTLFRLNWLLQVLPPFLCCCEDILSNVTVKIFNEFSIICITLSHL